jgi:hypothetical protein
MITRQKLPELRTFAKVEARLPMADAPDMGALVVPNGNASQPIHQWFRYKEAFASGLLRHVLRFLLPTAGPDVALLDPFCGVGTTLLAAQEASAAGYRITGIGIECNPFVALVATTKIHWNRIDADALPLLGEEVLRSAAARQVRLPTLSSITTGRCISTHIAARIVAIRDAILTLPASPTRDALLVGLGAAIEPVSRIRRDGRALRLVEKEKPNLSAEVRKRWNMMADDVRHMRARFGTPPRQVVALGDGRRPGQHGVRPSTMDLILTSPPYPNNIDYSEVYKLELWLLGFIGEADDFLALRKRTFRSHPTCAEVPSTKRGHRGFDAVLDRNPLRELIEPILVKVDRSVRRERRRVLLGYLFDTWTMLQQGHRALRAGGHAAIVVGNSLHGGSDTPYVIPTDILVAVLGECVGFEVTHLFVARGLKRRLAGNHFLRDSVVLLRKPT